MSFFMPNLTCYGTIQGTQRSEHWRTSQLAHGFTFFGLNSI
ncbi:Uncharacterized protein APZ42_012027 [Daphnia magna]|uniref:Uncharacterized protein n=1 Tax=Daphnia magna TaxID=35525 RepID=A0A162S9Z2_9CRUS|nr:Uncharacterized protein APZ42_012027 [Daphnia magna]